MQYQYRLASLQLIVRASLWMVKMPYYCVNVTRLLPPLHLLYIYLFLSHLLPLIFTFTFSPSHPPFYLYLPSSLPLSFPLIFLSLAPLLLRRNIQHIHSANRWSSRPETISWGVKSEKFSCNFESRTPLIGSGTLCSHAPGRACVAGRLSICLAHFLYVCLSFISIFGLYVASALISRILICPFVYVAGCFVWPSAALHVCVLLFLRKLWKVRYLHLNIYNSHLSICFKKARKINESVLRC